MKIIDIPFNALIGLKESASEALLQLPNEAKYGNHLGTVHAAALFALAEASAGELLLQTFKMPIDTIVPVVRSAELSYKRPAKGAIYSYGKLLDVEPEKVIADLIEKNRVLFQVQIDLKDEEGILVFSSKFTWFVSRIVD